MHESGTYVSGTDATCSSATAINAWNPTWRFQYTYRNDHCHFIGSFRSSVSRTSWSCKWDLIKRVASLNIFKQRTVVTISCFNHTKQFKRNKIHHRITCWIWFINTIASTLWRQVESTLFGNHDHFITRSKPLDEFKMIYSYGLKLKWACRQKRIRYFNNNLKKILRRKHGTSRCVRLMSIVTTRSPYAKQLSVSFYTTRF